MIRTTGAGLHGLMTRIPVADLIFNVICYVWFLLMVTGPDLDPACCRSLLEPWFRWSYLITHRLCKQRGGWK
jgi:hypothetical protein